MLAIRARADLKKALNQIGRAEKDARFASVWAATQTARDVRIKVQEEMGRVFDRPTPYTLRAFHAVPATKEKPVASVEQRAFAGGKGGGSVRDWLVPQSQGGNRKAKAFEKMIANKLGLPAGAVFIMPGPDAKLDRYGNFSGGTIAQMLSDLGARADTKLNATARSRKRNKRARHFIMYGGASMFGIGHTKTPWAIAQREGPDINLIAFIVRKAPRYSKRFDFDGVALREATAIYPVRMKEGLSRFRVLPAP